MDDWDLLTSSCRDVRSRRCEGFSCDRSWTLSFLSGEPLLVSILMKRGHYREGRPLDLFIWWKFENTTHLRSLWNPRLLEMAFLPDVWSVSSPRGMFYSLEASLQGTWPCWWYVCFERFPPLPHKFLAVLLELWKMPKSIFAALPKQSLVWGHIRLGKTARFRGAERQGLTRESWLDSAQKMSRRPGSVQFRQGRYASLCLWDPTGNQSPELCEVLWGCKWRDVPLLPGTCLQW